MRRRLLAISPLAFLALPVYGLVTGASAPPCECQATLHAGTMGVEITCPKVACSSPAADCNEILVGPGLYLECRCGTAGSSRPAKECKCRAKWRWDGSGTLHAYCLYNGCFSPDSCQTEWVTFDAGDPDTIMCPCDH